MDRKLVDWARAVGRRRRSRLPTLWLFTDETRLPNPLSAVAGLPRGAGVVFRHDSATHRAALGRAVARICRARGLTLVVAGDARLAAALGAGLHMRNGRAPRAGFAARRGTVLTSSAHDAASLRRASRADVVFLSPAFPTASHPGQRALGPLRWNRLARRATTAVAALGGIESGNVRRLSARACAGVGAIGALAPDPLLREGHSVSRSPCEPSPNRCDMRGGAAICPPKVARSLMAP